MLKILFLFIIITITTYSSENYISIKCNKNNFDFNVKCTEEKEAKFGQEVFDNYKKQEKILKKQLNNLLVPKFMSKSFKVDLDLEKINSFKIAYIYYPQDIKGVNFKVEWDKQFKFSSSFKKEFDISKIVENVSGVITNTFIPE